MEWYLGDLLQTNFRKSLVSTPGINYNISIIISMKINFRLWVQSAFLVLATPFAALTIYLEPPYCFIALALYYLFAETWFAILFTVIVEIVPANTRAICSAFFIFVMNIIAGEIIMRTTSLGGRANE